jgi:hypothetical protein
VGQFLVFRHYDLGVKSLTVGTQEGWNLAPRSFLQARLPMGQFIVRYQVRTLFTELRAIARL